MYDLMLDVFTTKCHLFPCADVAESKGRTNSFGVTGDEEHLIMTEMVVSAKDVEDMAKADMQDRGTLYVKFRYISFQYLCS